MDSLSTEILIRIFDKSCVCDQLISHRLINRKFRTLTPTASSRLQRIDTSALVTVSKKLAFFGHEISAHNYVRIKSQAEDPEINRAFADLLLYVCSLSGASLKSISFTTPVRLDSATMEKLVTMCPGITEINVGFTVLPGSHYSWADELTLFKEVFLSLPNFLQLEILRMKMEVDEGETLDTAFLQPIVARLRLRKLRTVGQGAPLYTADPNLLEELVVEKDITGPYEDNKHRLCEIFPNLRRHYLISKRMFGYGIEGIELGEAKENYRRLRMLRGSSYIGSMDLWFVDENLFQHFSYLQNMHLSINDNESCNRFIQTLHRSRNWKNLTIHISRAITNDKCMQLLHSLFYTTAVQLKSLSICFMFYQFKYNDEYFSNFDKMGDKLAFEKTLRHCSMDGWGALLLAAKIANACKGLKSLKVEDPDSYGLEAAESSIQEPLRTALTRFQQADLRNMLCLSLRLCRLPGIAYELVQCFRGSKLHTLHLVSDKAAGSGKFVDADWSSLPCQRDFPSLRQIDFTARNQAISSDTVVNLLRNLPDLQHLTIDVQWKQALVTDPATPPDTVPPVQLNQTVLLHIVEHPSLQFCSIKGCSVSSCSAVCDSILTGRSRYENGRMLPWLHTQFNKWIEYKHLEERMGPNVYCYVETSDESDVPMP